MIYAFIYLFQRHRHGTRSLPRDTGRESGVFQGALFPGCYTQTPCPAVDVPGARARGRSLLGRCPGGPTARRRGKEGGGEVDSPAPTAALPPQRARGAGCQRGLRVPGRSCRLRFYGISCSQKHL